MTSLAIYLLPAVLIAVFQYAAPAEDGEALRGPLVARHNALKMLQRRRSLESALSAPSLYPEQLESMSKRDDDVWIWMPAHGFMQVPDDEVIEEKTPQKSQGTLLRYG